MGGLLRPETLALNPDDMHLCVDRPQLHPVVMAAVAVQMSAANAPPIPPLVDPAAFDLDGDGVTDQPVSKPRLVMMTAGRWPNRTVIKVGFLDGPARAHEETLALMRVWSQYANIGFDPVDVRQADCRISYQSGQGSWSYLGTGCKAVRHPEPTMVLGWFVGSDDREKSRVAIHETGHLLDCPHEHMSPERPDDFFNRQVAYRVFGGPPNHWSPEEVDQQVLNKYTESQTWHTRIDPESVMMYRFEPPLTRVLVPGNHTLSELDKTSIATLYPGRGAPTPPPPDPTVPPVVGDIRTLTLGDETGARSRFTVPGQPARFRLVHDRPNVRFHLEFVIRNAMGRIPEATIAPVGSQVATRLKLNQASVAARIKAPVGEYEVTVFHPDARLTGPAWIGGWYDDSDRPWGPRSA